LFFYSRGMEQTSRFSFLVFGFVFR